MGRYVGPTNVVGFKRALVSFHFNCTLLEKYIFPPKVEVSTTYIFGRADNYVLTPIVSFITVGKAQIL